MPIDVQAQVMVDAEVARVAAYAMDPLNDPIWIGGIKEADTLTDGPIRIGSAVRRVASFLGRRFEYVLEVAELEPARRIVMRSIKSPFPMEVTYTFRPDGHRTLARIHIGGDAGRLYRIANPIMQFAVKRSISGDLRRLKSIVEGGRDRTVTTSSSR